VTVGGGRGGMGDQGLTSFTLKVLNPKHVLFEGMVTSAFFPGDLAEFELLAHHAPIVSLLKEGNVVIDWKTRIPIRRGMVRFLNNECVVLVEESVPRWRESRRSNEDGAAQDAPRAVAGTPAGRG
jgi:F-type H+-transporting ATPase subunit epsilon